MRGNHFFGLIIFLFSCKDVTNSEFLEFVSNTKNFSTHDKLDVYYKSYQVVGDSLLLYNAFKHELIFLDLKSDSLHTVPLELNGPNGINSPIGFTYTKGKDFLLADDFSISKINSEGERLTTVQLSDESMYQDRDLLYSNPAYPGYRNHLIFNEKSEEVFLYFQKTQNESHRNIFGLLNLKDQSITPLEVDYPEIYDDVEFTGRLFQLSTTQSDQGAYFVFSGSPEIKFIDFTYGKLTSKEVASFEGKQNSDPPLGYEASDGQFRDYLLSNPFYNQIHFDKNTELLYRISSPEIGNEGSSDPDFFNNRQFILTVMDKEMNVLGHIELEKGRYDGNFVFAYSEGLWLSLNRTLQTNENLMQGDLIKLKGIHY